MKIEIKEKINKLLDSVKLKRTEPRRTILEALLRANKPQTADEIIIAIGDESPNKVTVYRTLESLVGAGLVHRAFIDERSQRYELADKCTEHQCHPHFVCTDCGQTHCMTQVTVPMATSPPAGFVIHRQQVRLEGLCPSCGNTGNRQDNSKTVDNTPLPD
jgi:Fur family ferric uptake transcriptional regulator